jgi:NAD(P)-dependent dehydrogenase (short-subunit alcohol dehydrogenase family)
MNPDLTDAVVLVTGAGGGLGRASAELLSSLGASVVVVDIDEETATDVAAALPGPAVAVQADVSVEADVERAVATGVAAFGRIDHHHLNAGIFGTFAAIPDIPVDDFDRVMNVNVRGQFLGLRAAFRRFEAQGSTGNIVLTASIASLTGSADLLPYQTSKHATVGLVHGAAMYGGPLGIRVNGVAPGIVPTELFGTAAGSAGGKNDMVARASTTPLRRAGTPGDIASVVAFLLGPGSAYVTGQILPADGGASIVNTVRPSGGAGAWSVADADAATYGNRTRSTT